ncbi:MAG: hypothetical protein IPL51_09050 [Candidatus Competibacteraceae bacterium]|nr:hypothetical protein [Candidatus Competibacteraceae bacterium]
MAWQRDRPVAGDSGGQRSVAGVQPSVGVSGLEVGVIEQQAAQGGGELRVRLDHAGIFSVAVISGQPSQAGAAQLLAPAVELLVAEPGVIRAGGAVDLAPVPGGGKGGAMDQAARLAHAGDGGVFFGVALEPAQDFRSGVHPGAGFAG